MFPTTIWSTIGRAGGHDEAALQAFAERYRPAVLRFLRWRGFAAAEADDVCQDVFVRVLRQGVLAKADPERGRFRNLLLTVVTRTIQDRARRRRELSGGDGAPPAVPAEDFDRAWALHLTERALARLAEEGSPYHEVLREHLGGRRQDRRRLWHARRRLADVIREEIAETCRTPEEAADELAYLAKYLRPTARKDGDDAP